MFLQSRARVFSPSIARYSRLFSGNLRGMSSNAKDVKTDTQTGHKDVTTKIAAEHNKNVIWSDALLTKEQRIEMLNSADKKKSDIKGHKGATLWITGLSGSGKSTIGAALEVMLLEKGVHAYRLDGDNIRFGLNKGLGFSAADRDENLRRIGEVAALFSDAGIIAITSFISPYKSSRDAARKIHNDRQLDFVEVFADVPLEVAESRDPKGLYKKARKGEIKNFTGISDPYEAPDKPEVVLPTHQLSVQQSCEKLIEYMKKTGIIKV